MAIKFEDDKPGGPQMRDLAKRGQRVADATDDHEANDGDASPALPFGKPLKAEKKRKSKR